ncbi:FGGY-family carbohydrate kinase [Fibrella aquatilis]|uniref:Carbohydrate kinase n=1 Tax=Fibrella aquatilis TaxID=2817059 RepID=A0A939K0Z0_9BACT|nr:FGGY family carbohydrate kinase [Fibrella aquatilis]MBO0932963.1 carbohydrate kinase [Fibrella aquatilis]
MPLPVIAVFDIGKTNKKLFLFDEQYRIVWEQAESFTDIADEDGDPCEDVARLSNWVQKGLAKAQQLPEFEVKALNFSTYGASFAYVDADYQSVGQLYNYLKPFPSDLRERFYNTYGDPATLSLQTASPCLDSLNSGLMLYRIKHDKPALFEQILYALHLPQFISFLFTGQPVTDCTSLGCHTMLWDFKKQDYADWVEKEALTDILGPITPSNHAVEVPVNGRSVQVGVGLHDSSAALIPYLSAFKEPFVLLSTGTWCVSMNPFNRQPLTAEELQYDCLNYLHYGGQPVKASRLFAGYEHEQQIKRLARHFQAAVDTYTTVAYNPALIETLQQRVSESKSVEFGRKEPMISMTGSIFNSRDLSTFATYELAYHQLMLDIMAQQLISTNLVITSSPVKRLFVDGGFGKNPIYMHLLARAFPDIEVYAASVAQASALGAALAIHDHWNKQPMPTNSIDLKLYSTQ